MLGKSEMKSTGSRAYLLSVTMGITKFVYQRGPYILREYILRELNILGEFSSDVSCLICVLRPSALSVGWIACSVGPSLIRGTEIDPRVGLISAWDR